MKPLFEEEWDLRKLGPSSKEKSNGDNQVNKVETP
jgi:hypothetical protein